jgi:heptosyltransferase-2
LIVRGSGLDNPQKILVRTPNWVGDAVISLPALEALRARFPKAEIVLATKPWVSEVYRRHPAVSRQMIFDPRGGPKGIRGFYRFVRALRDERFDAAVLFQNAFHAAWMARSARIPLRFGYARDGRGWLLTHPVEAPPAAAYGHQVYYYLHLLFRAGLISRFDPVPAIHLQLAADERLWAAKYLEALGLSGPRFLVGLNPGGFHGPAKRWLPERYAALADRLIGSLHADVLIFDARAEKSLAEEIARVMKHTPVIVESQVSLRQLMSLLGACRLVVSNDSGPMHLAAALGVPVVSIFGSTDERATGPLGPHTRVVRQRVPCSPCWLRECPIDFRCMRGVTVEAAYQVVVDLIEEAGCYP